MLSHAFYAGIGFVAGAFCPSIMRMIKALFVKDGAKAVSLVDGEIAAAKKDLGSKI
jgi:hypothetical protein